MRDFHKARSSCEASVKMESQVIFDSCWRRFEDKRQSYRVPREIIWLNGAPGSGKGINTTHILKARGLSRSVTISSLLAASPEAKKLIDKGEMITDVLVGDVLLEAVLSSPEQDELGLVVDGFPRTALQVDFLKLLYDKLQALHLDYADTTNAHRFPRPSFKVVMLYVDEETSIERQMQRARVASLHNKRVLDAGADNFHEERATDISVDTCKKRYAIFKTHYPAILRLKQFFPFHLIDAMGSLDENQEQIVKELRFQSSLDLNEDTYSAIRHLPLAKDLVKTARQQLVRRLDEYCEKYPESFEQVIAVIDAEVFPVLQQNTLAGHAEYVTQSSFFTLNPVCVSMLIDILTDRGYQVSYVREEVAVPNHIDMATGKIVLRREPVHRFRVGFESQGVRQEYKAMEIAARMAEAANQGLRISQSFIPEQLNHESKYKQSLRVAPMKMRKCNQPTPTCDSAEDVEVYFRQATTGVN